MPSFRGGVWPRTHSARTCGHRTRSGVATLACKQKRLDPNQVLSDAQLQEWKEVALVVKALNPAFDDKDADKIVSRAFGWASQKWWRGDVIHEPPSLAVVQNVIAFLKEEVGFDEHVIGTRVLKKFPEVIRMDIERMRQNRDYLKETYPALNSNPKALLNSLTEQPAALGYDVDCGGDCMSECSRCWVRFE